MNQVNQIYKYEEKNLQNNDSNRFETCEQVVEALVEQGLPRAYSPVNFITKIANAYGISASEARTCLKLAVKQLESNSKNNNQIEEPKERERYAQCGYYYPSGYATLANKTKVKDEMESLSSLGSYNRLMFGLK